MHKIDERLCRMDVDFKEPPVRTPGTPVFRAYVVMGDTDHAACVKPITISRGSYCPFIECNWQPYQDGSARLTEIRIPGEFIRRGWYFLEKAYDAEGDDHGKEQWHAFQKACQRDNAFHEKGDRRIIPGFPDELLPKLVRETLKFRDKKLEAWKPDMGDRGRKKSTAEA